MTAAPESRETDGLGECVTGFSVVVALIRTSASGVVSFAGEVLTSGSGVGEAVAGVSSVVVWGRAVPTESHM